MRVGHGSFVVLEDVDLTVAGGEIVAVTGVNGAGKSTLLSCLAGLHRPMAGTVAVLGGPPRDDAAFWRAVALVADEPTWYPGLSLQEHLELVRLTHEPVQGWCLPTDELLEVFGLAGRADAVPTDLSSGQRQRLLLAVGRPVPISRNWRIPASVARYRTGRPRNARSARASSTMSGYMRAI